MRCRRRCGPRRRACTRSSGVWGSGNGQRWVRGGERPHSPAPAHLLHPACATIVGAFFCCVFQGHYSEGDARTIFRQLIEALQYLHSK